MKALYFDGTELREREMPKPAPAEGEALVKIRYAGICSTDLEILKGYMDFRGIPGHEFVGTVEEAGDSGLIGKRAVGEINCPCGTCGLCERGLGKHCASRGVIGISGRDGAFAEYLAIPEANLHVVPEGIPDESAVFTELVAAACEFLTRTGITPEMDVAVLGDGRLAALVAQAVSPVSGSATVIGLNENKMKVISSLGIETMSLAEAERAAKRYDLTVECTGSPNGLPAAIRLARPGSVIVLKSTLEEDTVFNQSPVVVDELTIIGSRCGPFDTALKMLENGQIQTAPLLSAIFPFASWREAFSKARGKNIFKVILELP